MKHTKTVAAKTLLLSLNNEKNLRTRINRAFEGHQGSI